MKGKTRKILSLLLIIVIVTISIIIKNLDKKDLKNTASINNSKQKATVKLLENETTVGVTGLTVDSEVTIFIGEGKQLNASVLPGTATDKRLTWESSNPEVATVYSNGYARGLAIGTATITVTSVANPNVTKTIRVNVTEVTARAINVNKVELNLEVGDTEQLTATVLPSTIKNKAVTWRTSNSKIATVDTTGKVKAIGVGTATITITSCQNTSVTKTVSVKVSKKNEVTIDTSIKSVEINIGETRQISISNISNNSAISASKRSIIWSTQNRNVATVQSDGIFTALVKGINSGTTTIVATSPLNPNDKIAIQVVVKNIDVHSIATNKSKLELAIGETGQVETTVSPDNATNKKLTYKIARPDIASVSSTGKVFGRRAGTTNLIISSVQNPNVIKNVVVVVKEVPLTRIDLNVNELTLRVGEKAEIVATYIPENSKYGAAINWTMKNSKIASFKSGHYVEALSEGTTTLTVKSTKYTKIKKTITINVIGENATSVTFEKKNYEIGVGSKIKLEPIIKPESADISKLEWISSNSSIAKVDTEGNVTGLKEGTVGISIRQKSNNKIMNTVVITVKKARVSVEDIMVAKSNVSLKVGSTQQAQVFIIPPTATNTNLIWQSSNSKVAKVNSKGLIRGLSEGTTTITVTSADNSNAKKTIAVTVKEADTKTVPIESISVNTEEVIIGTDTSYRLIATVKPANVADKKLIWKSKNTKIATVSETGEIRGIKQGTTKVTVISSENKKITKEIKVYVKKGFIPAKSISIKVGATGKEVNKVTTEYKEGIKYVNKGDSFKITANINPENATNKEIIWKVKDEKVLSVDKEGTVKALKKGYTTITISSKSNKYILQKVYVNVLEPVTKVEIKSRKENDAEYIALSEGKNEKVKAIVSPTTASNRNVIWESDNPEVATVDQRGNITGVKEGTATISAISDADNSKHAEITVYVGNTAGSIYALATQLRQLEGDNILETVKNTVTNARSGNNSSIIIESRDKKLSLVNTAEDGTCNFIKKQLQNIQGTEQVTLEYLFITVYDEAHTGCYKKIINDNNIDVKNVVLKETSAKYENENYYIYLRKIATDKNINVINASKFNEGNELKMGNTTIKTYNTQNVFKGKEKQCKENITGSIFYQYQIEKTKDGKIQKMRDIDLMKEPGYKYVNFKISREITLTDQKYTYQYHAKGIETSPCDENTNSLVLLVGTEMNNGRKIYTYLPGNVNNNGYPVTGLKERKTADTPISNEVIYGNSETSGINEKIYDYKSIDSLIDEKTVFYDAENKVTHKIAEELGEDGLSRIKIYQIPNFSRNDIKTAFKNLKIRPENVLFIREGTQYSWNYMTKNNHQISSRAGNTFPIRYYRIDKKTEYVAEKISIISPGEIAYKSIYE